MLRKLFLDITCNFDSAESVEQLAQVIDKCHSLTEIEFNKQQGTRKITVTYTPFEPGFFTDTQAMIEVHDAKSGQLLKNMPTDRSMPIKIEQDWTNKRYKMEN